MRISEIEVFAQLLENDYLLSCAMTAIYRTENLIHTIFILLQQIIH